MVEDKVEEDLLEEVLDKEKVVSEVSVKMTRRKEQKVETCSPEFKQMLEEKIRGHMKQIYKYNAKINIMNSQRLPKRMLIAKYKKMRGLEPDIQAHIQKEIEYVKKTLEDSANELIELRNKNNSIKQLVRRYKNIINPVTKKRKSDTETK
jgi:hypothetical protein